MNISGAIFDMDGTLLDSMGVWEKMGSEHLRRLGYEPHEDIDSFFTSFSLKQAAEHYKNEYHIPMTLQEIMESINLAVEKKYLFEVKAKEGVKDFLKELSSRGVILCVATGTEKKFAQAALLRCGISGYFKDILTCTELGHSKSEPVIYRECLKALGTTRENTLVFEDAFFAANTAKNDGFKVCGVYDRHERKKDELFSLTDIYIRGFNDFNSFFKRVKEL